MYEQCCYVFLLHLNSLPCNVHISILYMYNPITVLLLLWSLHECINMISCNLSHCWLSFRNEKLKKGNKDVIHPPNCAFFSNNNNKQRRVALSIVVAFPSLPTETKLWFFVFINCSSLHPKTKNLCMSVCLWFAGYFLFLFHGVLRICNIMYRAPQVCLVGSREALKNVIDPAA